jgi:hypothetical protein
VTNCTAFGDIDATKINNIVGTFKKLIIDAANGFGINGIAIQSVLDLLNIKWLNIDDSQLEPYDGYFIFDTNPVFNITALTDQINDSLQNHLSRMF